MVALPSLAAITDIDAKKPDMIPVFGAQRDFVAALLGAGVATELTIAAGAIVATQAQHSVDTEGDAASDNLDTISIANVPDGWLLLLTPANAARVVTLRHDQGGDGEIILTGGASLALDHASAFVLLRLSGIQWIEVLAFNGNRLVTSANGRSLIAAADYAAMRTLLGLVIGTNVQAYDAELAAIAGLTSAADRLPYFTGSGTAALATFTAAGRALVDDADAAAQRATLGSTTVGDAVFVALNAAAARTAIGAVIGTDVQAYDAELAAIAGLTSAADRLPYFTGAGTAALATFTAAGRALVDDADAAAQRTTLGLVIGTNVQAYDAELAALAGLTSAADKLPYFTGAGTAANADFTAAGRALVDDADAAAQRTTLGLVIGTNVQAYDAELAALAGLTSAADRLPYFTGSGTAALATFTAAGRALVDDADAAAQRATLGSTTVGDAVFVAVNAAAARTAIGIVIGTDVQAYDAELAAIAGLTSAADRLPYFTGSGTAALATFTAAGRALVDDADAAAQRTTLGLVIGTDVQAYDADTAKLDVEDQTITGGAAVTSKSLGTQSSGTLTLDMGDRPLQHYTNGGAHTLAPGTPTGSALIDITNNGSAGAITTSGWTKVAGDAFTTTNGHKFRCHASVGNGGSLLIVQALQ